LIVNFVTSYDPTSFDFVFYGDSHAGYEGVPPNIPPSEEIHSQIIDRIFEIDPDLVFHTGDYVDHGCENADHLGIHNDITEELNNTYPYYLTTRNHDVCEERFWYYVNYKDALFVSLYVPLQYNEVSQERYDWLENILRNSDKRFKFVFFHNPSYSTGMRGPNINVRSLDPLFRNYNVDIVFNGHTHAYERFKTEGVNYVVTGGAGGVPHDLTGTDFKSISSLIYSEETYNFVKVKINRDGLVLTAMKPDGTVIDEMNIIKPIKKRKPFLSMIMRPFGF